METFNRGEESGFLLYVKVAFGKDTRLSIKDGGSSHHECFSTLAFSSEIVTRCNRETGFPQVLSVKFMSLFFIRFCLLIYLIRREKKRDRQKDKRTHPGVHCPNACGNSLSQSQEPEPSLGLSDAVQRLNHSPVTSSFPECIQVVR